MEQTFDTIIVGAGSAGCVLANRLSRDPNRRVLLLEAGGWDWSPLTSIPMACSYQMKYKLHNWWDISEPDAELNGRRQLVPHGKVIGGTSSLNYMAHTRGHPADYARWVEAGADGWSYKDVLPFFKETETWEGGEDEFRGGSGELGATAASMSEPMHRAWFKAAERMGLDPTEDYNAGTPHGVGPIQYTIRNGRRASSSRMFLHPVLNRPNLTVRTRAHVTRVLFEDGRAVGVEYQSKDDHITVRCRDRIVLCLGAINTPHLLMLSGVGPAGHLHSHGIPVIADLPVGKNLEDHLGYGIFWERTEPGEFHKLLRVDRIAMGMLQAYLFGKGPASTLPAVIMALAKSKPELAQPDLELLFHLPAPRADFWFPIIKPAFQDNFGVRVYLTSQKSRGEILLRSTNPMDRPLIHYNSLQAREDLETLRAGFKQAWAAGNSPELAPYRGKPVFPKTELQSDEEIDAFIRKNATQQYHPASSCRMGSGDNAVLNPDLSVRGLAGLHVVDASAMPHLIAGNPNVVIMMMAAKAAAMWNRSS